MNKSELIAVVAEKTGITQKDAQRIVTATFDAIADRLAAGEKVQLAGFGVFETRTRVARMGQHPVTREPLALEESRIPSFRASQLLKEQVGKAYAVR